MRQDVLVVLNLAMFAAVALSGCEPAEGGAANRGGAGDSRPVHVDSVFPIEEEIRRFRQTLGPEPEGLRGGTESLDALIRAFAAALERADTAALQRMVLSPEEFGYLYYPTTQYTRRPYALSPALVWFQLQNHGSLGFQRLMRRFGGGPLGMTGYRCGEEPLVQGENRVWSDCLVELRGPEGDRSVSLFGAILERDRQFKFVSYANRVPAS